jgi:hypothetical protein
MTAPMDDRIAIWLRAEAPTRAPARTLSNVLEQTAALGQERAGVRLLGRSRTPLAAVAASAILAVGAAIWIAALVRPAPNVGVTPAPSPVLTPVPLIPVPPRASWVEYGSAVTGLVIQLPSGWNVTPATEPWPFGERNVVGAPWLGSIVDRTGRFTISLALTELPETSRTLDAWVAAYDAAQGRTTCASGDGWVMLEGADPPWRIREDCGRFAALAVIDGRGVFAAFRPSPLAPTPAQVTSDRLFFEEAVRSIRLTTEG